MSMMDIVKGRRSVRTFDGQDLTAAEKEDFLRYAETVQNPWQLEITWKLMSAKEYGLSSPVITGTDLYFAGKMKLQPGAEKALGFAFEKLVLYAAEKGLGTTWIGGTMDRGAFERAMELKEGEIMPCVSPLGRPAAKMSLRETLMRKGVKADSRKSFEELFFEESFESPLSREKSGALGEALEMVRWAPSAVNKQPWRLVVTPGAVHFYEKRSKGYISAQGWDMQKIDMGIAICHFCCGLEEQGRTWSLELKDPGISAPADTLYIATLRLGD